MPRTRSTSLPDTFYSLYPKHYTRKMQSFIDSFYAKRKYLWPDPFETEDEGIDTSDIPEVGEDFFRTAVLRLPDKSGSPPRGGSTNQR